MRGMKVHVPWPAVVIDEHGRASVLGEQLVRLECGGGDVAVAAQFENDPELGGEVDERIEIIARERGAGEGADLPGTCPSGPMIVWHFVASCAVDARGEVVDNRGRDEHDVVSV